MGKNKATNPAIAPEDFVRAWQTSETIQQVKEKLGQSDRPNKSFHVRASHFRKKGIPLKRYSSRSVNKMDVEALKKLAEDLVA